MLNPGLYVHSAGFIAPAAIPAEAVLRLSASEPDYAGIIPPMQLRRMSKAVRMGIGAAHACLQEAGLLVPDAIVVGTTMGCLQDTEVFLKKLVTQEERMLTPTAFIQSTHNTVAGQIALVTGCHGCNTTISQHGHSFEGAVMSAALYLGETPRHTVLCGAVDELTDTSFHLHQRAGVYASEAYAPDAPGSEAHGAIAGEGAGFLLLNKESTGAKALIAGLLVFSEKDISKALLQIQDCLTDGKAIPDTDALWFGVSGDISHDAVYQEFQQSWNGDTVLFKAQTGEWGTAIAPAICRAITHWPEGKDRIWIVNHYARDWSLWLLTR